MPRRPTAIREKETIKERVEYFLNLEQRYPTCCKAMLDEDDMDKIEADYPFTNGMFVDIPVGWRRAFGIILLEELKYASYMKDIKWIEAKEKYGELRIYTDYADSRIEDVIEKYTVLSGNICIRCGRPDVPQTMSGWIEPVCKNCYERIYDQKMPNEKRRSYEEAVSEYNTMDEEMVSVFYNNVIGCKEKRSIDISATAKLIREFWNAKYGKVKEQTNYFG